jgi:CheY-like chemotaxis protein
MRLMEMRGDLVEVACNGQEAVARVEEKGPFDLILMDVHMPEPEGSPGTTLRDLSRAVCEVRTSASRAIAAAARLLEGRFHIAAEPCRICGRRSGV